MSRRKLLGREAGSEAKREEALSEHVVSSLDDGPGAPTQPRAELKRRASAGVFIVAARGLVIIVVGFGGTVVLARLLTPHDFGVIALGTAVLMVVALFSDGGLGSALIRREEQPSALELESLTGFQLAVSCAAILVAALSALLFGQIAEVVALMVCSTPFVALLFPGKIMLERSLSYRPLALVEVAQVVTYYVSAIALVAAGLGIWGLASATVIMRIAAATTMMLVSPVGFVHPRLSWHAMQPLLGFGLRFQAASMTWLIRDQGLSAAIAVIAGTVTLGFWTLSRRLLEVPLLLFESLIRVSFPTMSQLVARKENPARLIERGAGMTVVAGGIFLTALAGGAPGLIPGLFGQQWQEASYAVPGACLGLALGGSVAAASQGYLYAVGDANVPLRASVYQTVVWFAVALPLLPFLGVFAIGVGWCASAIAESFVLARGVRARTDARVGRAVMEPIVLGTIAGALGWLVADLGGKTLWSGLAGGILASALFLLGLLLFRRPLVFETYRFAGQSMRAALSRRALSGVA